MLKLFYSPGACSLASHIVLEELEIPYELIKVDLKTHKYGDEDFYKVNPLGTVPTLVLDHSQVLTQNSAILCYLGELDPRHQLMPATGSDERIRCIEWIGFINSDLHKGFSPLFKPGAFVDSVAAQEEVKKKAMLRLQDLFKLTDAKLKGKKFAMGQTFTIVDSYLFVMFQWGTNLKLDTSVYSNYVALIQQVLERPATQKALKGEGLIK